MPSVLDREITSHEEDAFGHRHYANALQSLIEAESNRPPFSVGVLGGWGTGKSTIKELYIASLGEDRSKDASGHIRSDLYYTITFNAWRYGGGDIKRALLRHVFLELGGDEARLRRELFGSIQRSTTETKRLGEYAWDVFEKRVLPLFTLCLMIAIIVAATWWASGLLGLTDQSWKGSLSLAFTALAFVLKDVLGLKSEPVSWRKSITNVELPRTTAEQYEDLLLEQLREFKGGKVAGKKGKHCERLVVFVDDLDRLSADEMVSGLDAIRTFMEIPRAQLPAGLGVVFVISCDEEKVAHALAGGRRRAGGSDLPASVFTRTDARRFLDRIFQFRLEIPQFPKRDMRQFILKKVQGLDSVARDLTHRGVSLESLVDRMIHVGVQSPRNALQILNAFSQSWWLATRREFEGIGNDRPGGLHEGAVTAHPLVLGALCALRVDFPEFFADLQNEPDLIARFTDVVIRGTPLEDQPESTREILEKYLTEEIKDGGREGARKRDVKKEHRPLRQFIASLQGLRWPPSLQPLLILTQDPITRKYGDRAPRLFDAFVSGDEDGVLEVLGRKHDTKPLQPEDVHMLRDMAEDLNHESDSRRVNAATVLAGLTNRLPVDQARLLVGPLARELGHSAELRWRVGIDKIGEVLNIAEPDDRVDVASKLASEILRPDGTMDFRLESGESPSLDEAIEIARKTCTLALGVRKAHGLAARADEQLLSWLESRRVAVDSGREYDLPFRELEGWVQAYEELVPALSGRYTSLVIAQLEAEEVEGFDPTTVLGRCRGVFDALYESGEESRPELWEQLTRLAGVRQPEGVALARDFMVEHPTAGAVPMSAFVAKFADRLDKEMRDQEAWKLDWKEGGQALLNLMEARLPDLDAAASAAVVKLTISWSEVKDTAEFSTRSLGLLSQSGEAVATSIITNWTSRLLTDLPERCIFELAERYPDRLNDKQRAALNMPLQEVADPEQAPEKAGVAYRTFMGHLPVEAFQKPPMQEHVRALFNRVGERFQNQSNYLERVFPVVPSIIPHSPPDAAGLMLQNLFTRAKGTQTVFGWLHSHMTSHWPAASSELGPYNPEQIFNDSVNFVTASPSAQKAWAVVRSTLDMVERGVVPLARTPQVATAACAAWQYTPEHVVETLKTLASSLNSQQTADLMDPVDFPKEGARRLLGDVWRHLASLKAEDERLEILNLILHKNPKGTPDEPDLCLKLWTEASPVERPRLLERAITQASLNDDQRRRLWVQIEGAATEFGPEFFKGLLPSLLSLNGTETTVSAVLESRISINAVFPTKDARFGLSDVLLRALPGATTNTAKVGIASWIKELDCQAVLRRVRSVEGMTQADLELLNQQFPRISSVKKALRKMANPGA